MRKLKIIVPRANYWSPGTDYIKEILSAVGNKLEDGDVVVISEKALSVATGNIVDESKIKPNLPARLLARIWQRIVWGYFLAILCGFSKRLVGHLRNYPLEEGAKHKFVALKYAGPFEALKFGSEGGIDVSNLPYSYAALPLREPQKIANKIKNALRSKTGKKVDVVIVDTDRTFSFFNFYFSTRKSLVNRVKYLGFFGFILGKFLKLKSYTSIVASTRKQSIEKLLELVSIAESYRSCGAGRDAWQQAYRFKTSLTGVTWEMLRKIRHKPIVIIRVKASS